jgi:hypothetical protein
VCRVDGFINLDASPGTKPILFRSSGGWMDEAFMRAAPQPHANVLVFVVVSFQSYTQSYHIFLSVLYIF